MKLLAIETSSRLGGLAVMDSREGIVSEELLDVHSTHSETLMGGVDRVLASAGLSAMELDAIAVSSGPGAFTGLRVGLGTAKGLAYATGAGIVAVPTLEAYALGLPYTDVPLAPMLDARKREVYAGLFVSEEGGVINRVINEQAIGAAEFAEALGDLGKVIFAGPGALLYREVILGTYKGEAVFASEEHMHPSPSAVAVLGMRLAQEGAFSEPRSLAPMYLRKSEAETKARRDK